MEMYYTKKYIFKYLNDIEVSLSILEKILDEMKPKRLRECAKEELEVIKNRVSGIEIWLKKDLEKLEEVDSDG